MKRLVIIATLLMSSLVFSQAKITITSIDTNTFEIDGEQYGKGDWEIYTDEVELVTSNEKRIGIRQTDTNGWLKYPVYWYVWTTDGVNPLASYDLTVAAIAGILAAPSGSGGTDDQTASEVPFTPNGTIAATNVQAAIQEVRDEASGSPDNYFETRVSGDIDDTFAVDTGNESKRFEVITGGTDKYYNIGVSFTTDKNAYIKSSTVGDFAVIVPDATYNLTGNGTSYVSTNTTTNAAPQGIYTDSLNAPITIRKSPTASLFWVEGYFKPYSISQVTGLASSNIAETSFDISWDAATASVGTISNYEYSIDGGSPVAVTGATTATVSGLTVDTAYNVNVRAVDAGSNKSQYSADLSVTPISSFTPLWAANAATPTPNEVDGTDGISIVNTDWILASVASPVDNGTRAIELTRNVAQGTTADAILQFQNLTIGQSYDFSFRIQITTGSPNNNYLTTTSTVSADWTVTAVVEYSTGNVGNWETRVLTMTPAVTNPRIKVSSSTSTGNVISQKTVIDNIIITAN